MPNRWNHVIKHLYPQKGLFAGEKHLNQGSLIMRSKLKPEICQLNNVGHYHCTVDQMEM